MQVDPESLGPYLGMPKSDVGVEPTLHTFFSLHAFGVCAVTLA